MATAACERRHCFSTDILATPSRQSIPPLLVCPGAPRKTRKLSAWSSASSINSEATKADALWPNGRSLESFQFGDAELSCEPFSLPSFPKLLRELPLLGEKQKLLEHPSPYSSASRKRGGSWSNEEMAEIEPVRRRLRLVARKHLKFGAPASPFSNLPVQFTPPQDAEVPECRLEELEHLPNFSGWDSDTVQQARQ